jgi:hypothetical protein
VSGSGPPRQGLPQFCPALARRRVATCGGRAQCQTSFGWQSTQTQSGTMPPVIERHFGVTYCPSGVWHLMGRLGSSPQKPQQRARERDEQAIAKWPTEDWPRIKKARREGRTIVFIDQTGFMLQPTVRRPWAPQGQSPTHHSWDRHERLSITGAITISPLQKRLGFYFSMLP